MDTDDDEIEQVMAALAAGDQSKVVVLNERFGRQIERVVRRHVEATGRHDVLRDADELAGLVADACFVIADRAGGWRPGGAAPWTWADLAIRGEVSRQLGHRVDELDDEHHDSEDAVPGTSWGHDPYPGLVEIDLRVQTFDEALRSVTSARDHDICIEYLTQQSMGDPSPASTVADRVGLTAAAVRQVVSRTRRKLRALAGDWPVLGDVVWLHAA